MDVVAQQPSAEQGTDVPPGVSCEVLTSWFEAHPGSWLENLPCSVSQWLGAALGSASAGVEPPGNKYCLGEQGALREL